MGFRVWASSVEGRWELFFFCCNFGLSEVAWGLRISELWALRGVERDHAWNGGCSWVSRVRGFRVCGFGVLEGIGVSDVGGLFELTVILGAGFLFLHVFLNVVVFRFFTVKTLLLREQEKKEGRGADYVSFSA